MKREEKNQQTRRRIIDSALLEFSRQSYGASSINTICSTEGISKGIIYHYFRTKDDLFLTCVEECFSLLTEYLRQKTQSVQDDVTEQLEKYFSPRMTLFNRNPVIVDYGRYLLISQMILYPAFGLCYIMTILVCVFSIPAMKKTAAKNMLR